MFTVCLYVCLYVYALDNLFVKITCFLNVMLFAIHFL